VRTSRRRLGASVRRVATLVASLLAVPGRGAAVASGCAAVPGRSGSIVGGRLARGASLLGLVGLDRVADRSADVASPGGLVAMFGFAVSGVGGQIGPIAVFALRHGRSVAFHGPRSECVSADGWCLKAAGTRSGMSSASWTAPAIPRSVPELRQAVVDFACEHGVPEPGLSNIRLAVSEAVANAVVHAFRDGAEGTVTVSVIMRDPDWVEVQVTDDGSGMAPRDDSPGLGLGLPLIRHLAGQSELRRPPGGAGTEVWMRFHRAAPSGGHERPSG